MNRTVFPAAGSFAGGLSLYGKQHSARPAPTAGAAYGLLPATATVSSLAEIPLETIARAKEVAAAGTTWPVVPGGWSRRAACCRSDLTDDDAVSPHFDDFHRVARFDEWPFTDDIHIVAVDDGPTGRTQD